MQIKLARTALKGKPKTTSLEEIEKVIFKEEQKIFYFDKENTHKDLVSLVEYFEDKDFSVYFREVKYGLDEADYMYEVHILR